MEKQLPRIFNVKSHFLDSGSFSLSRVGKEWARENRKPEQDFYETQIHWDYIDEYASFIKKNLVAIDFYANVDVIGNPELTLRNQNYLEKKHELNPVPVVHYPSDMKWLRYYLEKYDFIALGGLVVNARKNTGGKWLDVAWDVICDTPDRTPIKKIHGFGVTSHPLLISYPWWSVDSATWLKNAAFGTFLIPVKTGGEWDFKKPPKNIGCSTLKTTMTDAMYYPRLGTGEKRVVREWLDEIEVPLGKIVPPEEKSREGVLDFYGWRRVANLKYFQRLAVSLPYPRPFKKISRNNLGIT